LRYLADVRPPVVLKADGATAGKGVFIAEYRVEAQTALRRMMIEGEFGKASDRVVIEEYLSGREVKVLAFTDGKTVVPMPPARGYNRLLNDDEGAITESMGVYAPLPELTSFWGDEVSRRVLQPAVDGMWKRGTPYVGVLSASLMLTPYGFKTLGFKCGFDDVEAQALLPLLETDLAQIFLACVEGRLAELNVRWRHGASAALVLVAKGYPEQPLTGLPISGLEQPSHDETLTFHMGTQRKEEQIITADGRVLTISARGEDLDSAVERAYQSVQAIHFEGMHYRRDIGRALDD
jgi:phosphoribosylamine--glycine ligase